MKLGINATVSGAGIGIGLFGHIGNASVSDNNIIENVVIKGTVAGTSYVRNYGGLVGFLRGSTRIVHCTNYASVLNNNTSSTGGASGGICGSVGWNNGSTFVPAGTISFENCENFGYIHIENSYNTWINTANNSLNGCGGICGSLSGATSCTFTDCNNYGLVKSNSYYSGGIVGYCRTDVSFTGINTNQATALDSGSYYVGGIVGFVNEKISILGTARNAGKVKGSNNTGGIVGYLINSGTFSGTIESLNDASVTGSSYTGGIIGQIAGGPSGSIVNHSFSGTIINRGSVSGGNSTGGIIGNIAKKTKTNNIHSFSGNISNSGMVSSSSTYVGGFVGKTEYDTIKLGGTISNTAKVSGTAGVGGLCGFAAWVYVISGAHLTNSGRIISTGSNEYKISSSSNRVSSGTGGIIGTCVYYNTEDGTAIVENSGVVKSTGNKNDVGGIVGASFTQYIQSGNRGDGLCRFAGTITNSCDSIEGYSYIGGLLGYSTHYITIVANANVSNSSVVKGVQHVGGIAGQVKQFSYNNGCSITNSGKIEGSSNNVGGIVGYAVSGMNNGSTITSGLILNKGTVTGLYNVGGIGGYVSSGKIQRAINKKKIRATRGSNDGNVGGIIGYGYTTGDTLRIFNCCNYDTIDGGSAKGVGGIIGHPRANKGAYIYNCYNKGVIKGTTNYTGGIAGTIYEYTTNIQNCYSIDTVSHGGKTIAYRYSGTLNITNCYVNSDHPLAADNDNSTTTFVRTGANKGNLTTEQSIGGGSRTSLYAALHAWHGNITGRYYINSCDWEEAAIPRLSWEVTASKKAMSSRRRR